MIVYLWSTSGAGCHASGISDSDERARDAAGACVASGRADGAYVEQALTAIDATTLIDGYVRTGEGWTARRASTGVVRWQPFSRGAARA